MVIRCRRVYGYYLVYVKIVAWELVDASFYTCRIAALLANRGKLGTALMTCHDAGLALQWVQSGYHSGATPHH
jgi:hypothetical protein